MGSLPLHKLPYRSDFLFARKKTYTFNRSFTFYKHHVGKLFYIYSGKTFYRCRVTGDMVGHKAGEFSITKIRVINKRKISLAKKKLAAIKARKRAKAKAKSKKSKIVKKKKNK